MKKDLDYVAGLEKAIRLKYGEEAIKNPASEWDQEKEKEYLDQMKRDVRKMDNIKEKLEKVEVDGFFVSKKLLNRDTTRKCTVCTKYSFKIKDDIYMAKYDCCHRCYIQHVEHREERWESGWRPTQEEGE